MAPWGVCTHPDQLDRLRLTGVQGQGRSTLRRTAGWGTVWGLVLFAVNSQGGSRVFMPDDSLCLSSLHAPLSSGEDV